jgi:transglutaminase-like putative cysteine protease
MLLRSRHSLSLLRYGAALLAFTAALTTQAAPSALVVVGLTASETDSAQWLRLANQTRTGLIARGFAADNIAVLATNGTQTVTRESVLAALANAKTNAGKDACWVVLLGHSAPGRDDLPAFQVRGPRLTATDLHDALADFAGPTFVLFGTETSGDYLPALKSLPNCTAVAATTGPMSPRFPEFWVEALAANAQATFAELAAAAADRVASYYKDESLAQGENAVLLAEQKIQEAPFDGVTVAPPKKETAETVSAITALTSAEFPPPTPVASNEEFTTLPADDRTLGLLNLAGLLAAGAGNYPAVILHQELDYTFNADRSSAQTTRLRVYLRQPEAVEAWADYNFTNEPPAVTTVIESARVIQPDGSIVVVNPARLNSAPRLANSDLPLPFHVHLPQVTAGCIVEIAWRVEYAVTGDLPETYDEFPLVHEVPTQDTLLTLRTPKNVSIYHQFRQLPNVPAPTESATEHSEVLTWQLPALPAWEPLPNDPPTRDLVPMLAVSSLASWDAFTAWFHRVTQGTFEAGPATKAAAAKIAAQFASPADRLHAAYEEVSSLRYVAIEIGVNGFRPRSPDAVLANRYGDCKDKATLLSALLRELGIPADFALLNRGSSTDVTFPGWQFNHALVHVPAGNGLPEQWLDATDGTTPPGFVGPGDLGRNALVFSGDNASFLTITDAKQATSVTDSWTLAQQPDGSWKGELACKYTGLAEEMMREELGSLSPRQRVHWLLSHLAKVAGGAELANPTLNDLSNLSDPVAVHVEVTCPASLQPYGPQAPVPFAPTFPPQADLAEQLAAPERDRPFLVNDGQPLHYEQQVRVTYAHPVKLPAVEIKSANNPHVSSVITYARPDDHTVVRNSTLEISVPTVPADDYAAFRHAVLDWRRALGNPFPVTNTP